MKFVTLLLKYGANPLIKNQHGENAIDMAMTWGKKRIISEIETAAIPFKQKELDELVENSNIDDTKITTL